MRVGVAQVSINYCVILTEGIGAHVTVYLSSIFNDIYVCRW